MLRPRQRLDVRVVHFLLAVRQRLEALEDALQLLLVEVVAQLADALPQGRPPLCLPSTSSVRNRRLSRDT